MSPTAADHGPRDRLYFGSLGIVLVLDVLTKRWAEATLLLHTPVEVLGNLLRWTLTYNTGAAMNLNVGSLSRPFFSLVAVGMVVYLFVMMRQSPKRARAIPLALGLVSAGAIGNLVDRLRHAKGVVDFIDIGTASWRFWTFNVADIGVSAGAILLAIALWREDREAASVKQLPTPDPSLDQ
jgi:signal peptidase II